ncbi:MAG: zinc ribbon domain-containing protein, partial [Gammaproteobacteria bacterium]|nr:zinc ribbon domain-containing protein [Gammaproteobacteria bacterium]
YEYVCNECGHDFEALQKMSDAPLSDCPACKKSALKKKISAPGFRLSGSGWYETDFKSGNQKNLSKGDNDKNTSDKSSDKSSAKPDGKEKASGKEAAA